VIMTVSHTYTQHSHTHEPSHTHMHTHSAPAHLRIETIFYLLIVCTPPSPAVTRSFQFQIDVLRIAVSNLFWVRKVILLISDRGELM
jgi:hypothetical protein